jgi:site-specific recombinase XerD
MGNKAGTQKQKDMITSTIVFDHRMRTAQGMEGPLEVRVTANRKPYYIQTGVRVRANQWQFDKVVNHPQANALNERLGILLDKIMCIVNKCIENGQDIDIASVRRQAWQTVHKQTAIEWMRNEVTQMPVSYGTMKHYKSAIKRLEEFGRMTDWPDFTSANIYAFDAFIRMNVQGRYAHIAIGTAYNYHKCLKALLSRAEKSELIAINPYNRLRGEFARGDKPSTEYLTEEEMSKIQKFSPAPGSFMERARNLFIFQMFTGLSFSDMMAFDISEYKKVKGKWCIIASRIKTGVPYVNQLLPPAVDVLERYDMTLPKMTNQVYNRELKLLGMACGITIPLHSHLARHTFATFMLRNGAKIENVSRMLGHTNIKQTQRYAKVLAESVHEDFDKIEQLLKKKKV